MNSKMVWGIIAFIIVIAVAYMYFGNSERNVSTITNFQECTDAGYPIMESYPEQCATPDGRTFINDASRIPPPKPSAT